MNRILAENLKKYRTAKKLTQEQAAEKLGVSAQAVSRWECCTTLPDVTKLPEIAYLYGVTIDDLFRKTTVAYRNYAQRLCSVFEASRDPEDFYRAELEFQRLINSGEYVADDLRLYGVIWQYMMLISRDRAQHWLERCMEESAETDREIYIRARGQRMSLFAQTGRAEENLRERKAYAEEHPERAEAWNSLVIAYKLAGKIEEAYDCVKAAIERFPQEWELYANAGDICGKLGKYEEAFGYWDKSLEIEPSYEAKYSKAFRYQEMGELQKAGEMFLDIAMDLRREGFDVEAETEIERAWKLLNKE